MTLRANGGSPASLVAFEWSRMDNPHWVDGDGLRVLCGFNANETYRPLKSEPALFRAFASLPDREDAFAAFARSYGDLYDPDYLVRDGRVLSPDDGLDEGQGFDGLGNALTVWRAHRRLLAFALRLWDALNEGRARDVIGTDLVLTPTPRRQRGTHASALDANPGSHRDDAGGSRSPPERDSDPRRRIRLARLRLERTSSPETTVQSALATLITEMCGSVDVAMEISSAQPGALRLTFEVSSLIGAMWLQFALAVDGNRKYRSCPECGEWWDATETRSDRQTCSDRCRKRRHRADAKPQRRAGDGG